MKCRCNELSPADWGLIAKALMHERAQRFWNWQHRGQAPRRGVIAQIVRLEHIARAMRDTPGSVRDAA